MWPRTENSTTASFSHAALTTERVSVSHPAYAVVLQYWQTHIKTFCESACTWGGAGWGCGTPVVRLYLLSVEMPAVLIVRMTSPWDAGLALGSHHQPSASPSCLQGWGLCSAFYEGGFTKVSFHQLEHLLAQLSKTLQTSPSPAASLGFTFHGTPWCAGLNIHPMSFCPSPAALSVLGKYSSRVGSTRG